MKKSLKAALLSALLFPGAGHFFLKKKLMGTVLSGGSAFGLYYILSKILGMTELVMIKVQTIAQETNAQPDVLMMQKWVMEELASSDNQFISLAMIIIMLCWFVAVVDSYRIGLAVDKQLESER